MREPLKHRTVSLIPCSGDDCKPGFDWAVCAGQITRQCPSCGAGSIESLGWRPKQAHDNSHDWIRYRRGECQICRVTVSFLPAFSLPYTHYSLVARSAACAVALRRRLFLGRRRPAAQRSRSRARPFHPAPLVPQPGFFAGLLLSIFHAASCGAMDGQWRAARFRFSALVLVYRLFLSASRLALASASLRINLFLFLLPPPSSPGICGPRFLP